MIQDIHIWQAQHLHQIITQRYVVYILYAELWTIPQSSAPMLPYASTQIRQLSAIDTNIKQFL